MQLFEDGIYEIRIEVGRNIYRIFTFFDDNKLVILLHGFQKKGHKKRHYRAIASRGKNKPINNKSIVVPPNTVGRKAFYRMRWLFRRPHEMIRAAAVVCFIPLPFLFSCHCYHKVRMVTAIRIVWLQPHGSYSCYYMDCMV